MRNKNIALALTLSLVYPMMVHGFDDLTHFNVVNSNSYQTGSQSGEQFGGSLSLYSENQNTKTIFAGSPYWNGSGALKGKAIQYEVNNNGTTSSVLKTIDPSLSNNTVLGSYIGSHDYFGTSIATINDIDNNGINDIIVGSAGYDPGHISGAYDGRIYILGLGANDQVISVLPFAPLNTVGMNGFFGASIANIGDINNDGIPDIAVGAPFYNNGGGNYGRVYIFRMNANGTILATNIIDSSDVNTINGASTPVLAGYTTNTPFLDAHFGASISSVGDINNDGVSDIAIGSPLGDSGKGFINIFLLNNTGTVITVSKISQAAYPALLLSGTGNFGTSLAYDHKFKELFTGSPNETISGKRGAIRSLSLVSDFFPSTAVRHVSIRNSKVYNGDSLNIPVGINATSYFGSSILVPEQNGSQSIDLIASDVSDTVSIGGSVHSLSFVDSKTISGSVYTSNGVTTLPGKKVTLLINGVFQKSTISDNVGYFTFFTQTSLSDIITLYIDDAAENGARVFKMPAPDLNNQNIITDHVVLGNENDVLNDTALLAFTSNSYDFGDDFYDLIGLLSVSPGIIQPYSIIDGNAFEIATTKSWNIGIGSVVNAPAVWRVSGPLLQLSGGVFNHRNGNVYLEGSVNQEIIGAWSFYGLRVYTQIARSIKFPSLITTTIMGAGEFVGTPSSLLTLTSSDGSHVNRAVIDSGSDRQMIFKYISIIDIENSPNLSDGKFVIGPISYTSISNSPGSEIENDADGISNNIEDGGLNNGDGNGDGILDSYQTNVANIPNTVSGSYSTISAVGLSVEINNIRIVSESNLVNDSTRDYPVGLYDYSLSCGTSCASVPMEIYLDRVYDSGQWRLVKYNNKTKTYHNVSSLVNAVFTLDTSIGTPRTKITYTISDNGELDEDPTVGVIRDPIGPSVILSLINNNVSISQSSGGGGIQVKSLIKSFKEEIEQYFPKFESVIGEDSLILLQANKQLSLGPAPFASDFKLEAKLQKYKIVSVTIFRDQILLLLDKPIKARDVAYISYSKGENKITAIDGKIFPGFKNMIIANVSDPIYSAGFKKDEELCKPVFLEDYYSFSKKRTVEIKSIQEFLRKQKLYKGLISGIFDTTTIKAIKLFQIAYKRIILDPQSLSIPNGGWGPLTRAVANALTCKQDIKTYTTKK